MEDLSQGPISHRAQGLSVLGSLALLVIVIILVRRGYLKSGYSILWFLMTLLILLMSAFNELLLWVSNLTGIDYAPALIFSILFVGIILISIHFSVIISKHETRIKKLAQEVSLLKHRMNKTSQTNK